MSESSPSTESPQESSDEQTAWRPPRTDRAFVTGLCILGGSYIVFILMMLLANVYFIAGAGDDVFKVLQSEEIRFAIKLSLISCTVTMILSLWVATPIGYIMSRYEFRGKSFLDAILDVPIVLPPLVIGLSLLILFRQTPLRHLDDFLGISLQTPAVIVAQFSVACAFAVRTLRNTFDEIPVRREQVALTLGCSRSQAFWLVLLPEARRGMLTAATLAWARSLGEFGPILIFAGTTAKQTEVLSVSVYLQYAGGNLNGAVAVSLMMVAIAMVVLVLFRMLVGGNLMTGRNR